MRNKRCKRPETFPPENIRGDYTLNNNKTMQFQIRSFFTIFLLSMLIFIQKGLTQSQFGIYQTSNNHSFSFHSLKKQAINLKNEQQPSLGDTDQEYRRFGFSFGMGMMESNFTYSWKFIFHTSTKLALEGSFKHVLGETADSYFITANWSYLLKTGVKLLPYITGGMGVINTVPQRSVGNDEVSHMAVNYGIGARYLFRKNMSIIISAHQYSVVVRDGFIHFKELSVGLLVGNF